MEYRSIIEWQICGQCLGDNTITKQYFITEVDEVYSYYSCCRCGMETARVYLGNSNDPDFHEWFENGEIDE